MEYTLHGKSFHWDETKECGLYLPTGEIGVAYQILAIPSFVAKLGELPEKRAVELATLMRDRAAEQAERETTPHNVGYPILQQRPGPISIDEVSSFFEKY